MKSSYLPQAPSADRSSAPRLRALVVAILLTTFVGLAAAHIAAACTVPPPRPPDVWIILHEVCCDFHNPPNCYIRAWIIFHKYTTFGSGPGQFCGTAFPRLTPVLSVDGVSVVDASTGVPVPGFSFAPNDLTGQSYGAVGFLSPISTQVPAGIPIDLMLSVTLKDGTTFDDLAAALSSEGYLVTGEADSSGNLISHVAQTLPGAIMDGTDYGPAPTTTDPIGPQPAGSTLPGSAAMPRGQ